MTGDYRRHLIDGDPARDGGLDAFHADTMRQRVLLEARAAEREGLMEREGFSRALAWWLRPIAVAGALAACLVVAIIVGTRINPGDVSPARPAQVLQSPPRQLQFSTPGGTRIIWTFHQEFDL